MGGDLDPAQGNGSDDQLKSTPPAWAGTSVLEVLHLTAVCLNPPRPHGRGQTASQTPFSFS